LVKQNSNCNIAEIVLVLLFVENTTFAAFRFMIKYFFTFVLTFVVLLATAQIPAGYYDNTSGLSGEALKAALHDIIKGHHELSYDSVTIALRVTDQDTVDTSKVVCLYTGWTYGKYDFGNGSEDWNREHVWSKSHGDFGNIPPAGTDLHHLRPADASVNSAKNNRDFNWGVTQYIDGSGPTECYEDSDVWEPRDEVKGDVARMIFYMATRYEGDNGEVDLEVVDSVNTSSNKEPFYGKLSTLLAWNQNDPVSAWEQRRNDSIYYLYQNNRNPFIDHPEFIDSIWGTGILAEPSNHAANFTVAATTSSSVTLTWNNNDGAITAQNYLLLINETGVFTLPSDSVEYPNDTDLSDSSGVYNVSHNAQNYTWHELPAGTRFYFAIYPYNNQGNSIDYKTDSIVPQTDDSTDIQLFSPVLIISEVTHPSNKATAKYVEITNVGQADMDFSSENWYLSIQSNGGPTWRDISITGYLKADSSMTLAYSDSIFNLSYNKHPDIASGNITGNGNDGYFLYRDGGHTSGILVDAYGEIDQNGTGEPWEYKDSKAVRLYTVDSASSQWIAEQWRIESADVSSMTPKWHHKTYFWTGAVSSDWNNLNNWQVNGSAPDYPYDAGCYLIIQNSAIAPEITSPGTTYCTRIMLDINAAITISNGILKVGP